MTSTRIWKAAAGAAVLVAVASLGVAAGAERGGGPSEAAGPTPRGSAVPVENTFVPVAPCRIVNSQNGPKLTTGAGDARGYQMHGNTTSQGGAAACGIPTYATALEVSVTALRADGPGYLRIGPTDAPVPSATFLNYGSSQNLTNAGTVAVEAGAGLNFQVKAFVNPTHITVDVLGYYVSNLYAVVSPIGGAVLAGSGVVEVTKTGTGAYSIQFSRDTTGCAATGSVLSLGGEIGVAGFDPVTVTTRDSAGNPLDTIFTVAVVC